ncbi:MAG: Gfo/Idh/MocA family protein, partial [Alphaproteobacteria bacterium]
INRFPRGRAHMHHAGINLMRKEFAMSCGTAPDVTVIGGGMITQIQILPSLYGLQRTGMLGDIAVCALNGAPLKVLAEDETLKEAFPGQGFTPYPDFTKVDLEAKFPKLFEEVVAKMSPRNIVFVALPDQLHYRAIKTALDAGQNVLTVKPLVLSYKQAAEIEKLALEKGLFVGIEYHKRFDDRALMARSDYRAGRFGEFRLGQAAMVEPWYYRDSNFMNWCTCENSDMFTYVGCHYVDQVQFITGLMPVEVSVYGIRDKYPNGNEGFLWTDGRVLWSNGACLDVIDAMGYPNVAPGGNMQGMKMICRGSNDACLIIHEDQYRGLKYSYNEKLDDKYYHEPSPDYFKLVYRGGKGLEPVGYGYRSIEGLVRAVQRVQKAGDALEARRAVIREVDGEGVLATPANSSYNELVIEAGRLSIMNDGRPAIIEYGDNPHARLKEFA